MAEEELVREVHEMASQQQNYPYEADPTSDSDLKLRMACAMAEDAAAFWGLWLDTPPLDGRAQTYIETARAQFKQIAELIRLPLRGDG